MEEELKSLKNPTRILSILMFLAVIITSIGVESLSQALPFIPEATITVIVGVVVTQIVNISKEKYELL